MAEQKKQDVTSVLAELTNAVKEKVISQRGFAEHEGTVLTDDDATAAAMRAFVDHLHDPRTLERACVNYFRISKTDWTELNSATQEMWRQNMRVILQSVLE